MRRPTLHFAIVLAACTIASASVVANAAANPAANPADTTARIVDVIRVEGVISPFAAEQIRTQIRRSERDRRQALVLQIDTPGGLDASMRSIVKSILASDVPVISYVAPEGARAASAGLFLVTASHVAAMAPNTNLGAASPVALGGPMDSTMKDKATNDAAAFIESLAKERGRNAEWNVRAVRKAVAISEREAARLHVIDFVARDLEDLLAQANGREVRVASGQRKLDLTGATLRRIEPSLRHRLLSILADPTVAYILFNLGTLGLVFELSNPGSILPGVIGAICLVLALVAFQTLPVNLGGVLLILLAMVFFLAEIKVNSHGILAAGGILAFLVGSLILFQVESGPEFRVPLHVIGGTTLAVAAFFLFAVGAAIRAHRRRPTTGTEGLIGERGTAISACTHGHPGQVQVRGEIWRAEPAPDARSIQAGDAVEVVRLHGLTVLVRSLPVSRTEVPSP